ncbi:hypothetical protein FXO37_33285 [Capsicum annuum]|nr:hypothetical protein FXO37_33285 [Capsicum annuum]
MQRKHKLILTRPKEPEFVTAQRIRPTRVKSSVELEEEMMAKIPKFKARPLNKMAAPGRLGRGLIWAILVFRVVWVVKRAKQRERAIFWPIWCAIAHGFRGGREVQHNFGPKLTELPLAGGERPNVGHFGFWDIWVVKRVKRHEWAIFGPILCAISHGLWGRPGVRVRFWPKINRPAPGRLRSGLVWAILFFWAIWVVKQVKRRERAIFRPI